MPSSTICRRGPGSDIYLYLISSKDGQSRFLCHCCKCESGGHKFLTARELPQHLDQHRSWGHQVPAAADVAVALHTPLPSPPENQDATQNQ